MMKANCTWKEVYAIYDTLIPQEKLYLGKHFFDSPNTVFRWIVKRNGKNAGFIETYDMKRSGSCKGELIVSIAIQKKYRGMGILEELQDAAEQFVSSNSKYNRLIWLAKDNNEKSIHCAKKLGYTKKYHELDHWVFSKTIKNKELLESNSNKLNTGKNIDISPTDYKTCKSIYEQLPKKDKIAINAYGTSTVFSDGDEVVKRYCCTIDSIPAGFMEYSRYNDGYTYISIAILRKYRGKPYNIANRFITLAKMDNTNIRYVANKKNLASQKFIEKHPEFKLADKTRDCYVYEYHNNDKESTIKEFNKQLNDCDYGILINGKAYTGENIDWSKYKTISPKDFAKYFVGTCWDYTEYEAKVFKDKFGFNFTLNTLKHDREFSLYYMQINDGKKCPTHTWLAYRNNGKIYLFESSWKPQVGISKYNTEEEMVKDYIKKHRKENHDKEITQSLLLSINLIRSLD